MLLRFGRTARTTSVLFSPRKCSEMRTCLGRGGLMLYFQNFRISTILFFTGIVIC